MKTGKIFKDNCDLIFFLIMIITLNTHLVGVFEIDTLILFPDAVQKGEWWRLFTHPFVHVSWYHLVLDAGAFIILYLNLRKKCGLRFIHTVICCIASLVTIWFCSSTFPEIGFCGLSGVAHGLMIVLTLEMIFDSEKLFQSQKSKVGLIVFAIIMFKCTSEFTGIGIISDFHFGLCGNPIYESHIGGIIGGISSFFTFEYCGIGISHYSMIKSKENNYKSKKKCVIV